MVATIFRRRIKAKVSDYTCLIVFIYFFFFYRLLFSTCGSCCILIHLVSLTASQDMSEYGKTLGASAEDQADPNILWVVHQAFHSPLPASWTEHVDEDRVYYHNSATGVSAWNHPMDSVYRDLIQLIKKLRLGQRKDEKDLDERCAQAVQDHLLEVHTRFVADLGDWSGPFQSEDGDEYYFNERTQISTWVNPLEECQDEMSIRQAVLSRCLLDGQKQLDVPDNVTVPALQLPVGRREDEPFASARSFYTARSASPRSASPHSGRSKGSESTPGRNRSKGQPARALISISPEAIDGHENQVQEQSLDDTRTTATSSRCSPKIEKRMFQESQAVETKTGQNQERNVPQSDDEMDLTFGCSAMPKVQLEELAASQSPKEREDSDEPAHEQHVNPSSLPNTELSPAQNQNATVPPFQPDAV